MRVVLPNARRLRRRGATRRAALAAASRRDRIEWIVGDAADGILFDAEPLPLPAEAAALTRAARLPRARRGGHLPSRPGAASRCSIRRCCGCRTERGLMDDPCRPAGAAAAAGWRRQCAATSTRCTPSCGSANAGGRATPPLRRLVRAGAPHRSSATAPFFAAPLRRHGLVIATPDLTAAFGTATLRFGRRRAQARPARRRGRGSVAHLFRQHLQSGAPQARRDAVGDAEEILEEPARDRADSGAC